VSRATRLDHARQAAAEHTVHSRQFTSLPQGHAFALGFLSALALCAAFPITLIGLTPSSSPYGWPWAVAVMVVAGSGLAIVIGRKARSVFEMVFWLFTYVFFGAAPLVQLRLEVDPDTTPGLDHRLDTATFALVLVGVIAFWIGTLFARAQGNLAPFRQNHEALSQGRTRLLALIALALFAWFVVQIGPSGLFAARDVRSAIVSAAWPNVTTAAVVSAGVSMSLLVSTVAQVAILRRDPHTRKIANYVLVSATLIALLLVVNPVSSARYLFGTVALGLVAAFGGYRTVGRFRLVAASSVLGLLFAFPLIDLFRQSLDARLELRSPVQSLLSGDFDAFGQLTNTVSYVGETGVTYGNQLLGVLFFWVPRSIWAAKPVDTGILLANYRGYEFTNLSSPLWGEFYINGGWWLLVPGMLLFGVLVGRWDQRSEALMQRHGLPTVLGCVVPFYLLIVLRGSLLQSMAYLSLLVICALLTKARSKDVDAHLAPENASLRLSK